ncbi:kinase-like domain-containing protein [Naematelia encephala]|uniref:Kinase-like domain-containing protein n=1 Tax=Naematelia encephala TaxID=71784 RepID=A0A1Y2B3X4_9TREE|nr:kinase-like domain-containing protein [Naematelia encephala]
MPVKTTPRTKMVSIGAWTLGETLGRGAYAHVRLATHANGHQAACKILPALHRPRRRPLTTNELMDAVEAYKEVVILKGLAGSGTQGIVGLEGIMEENGWTYIFLELYPYSLSSVPGPWPARELVPFYRALLHTVHNLHTLDVCHEDLKRSNILVDHERHPVLVDFGFSHLAVDGEVVKSAGGTLDYSSPEKIASQRLEEQDMQDMTSQRYDPRSSDVWALGIVLTKMLGMPHPFLTGSDDEASDDFRKRIIECDPRIDVPPLKSDASEHLVSLLEGILEKDPVQRLTIPQILQHPFVYASHGDPPPFSPPSYQLSPRVKRRFDASVIRDLCFLSYLRKEFRLCQTPMDVEQRLYGDEPGWLKRWAVMLSRWRQRAEMDWEDTVPRVLEINVRRTC